MSSSLLKLTVGDSGKGAQQCPGQAQKRGDWVNWKPHVAFSGSQLVAPVMAAEDFITF